MAKHMAPLPESWNDDEQPDLEQMQDHSPAHGAAHSAPAASPAEEQDLGAQEQQAAAPEPAAAEPEPAAAEPEPAPAAVPTAAAGDAAQAEQPAGQKKPKHSGKRRGRKNIVSNILIIAGVALLVVAGVIFFNNERNYQKINEENERVAEYVKLGDDSNEPPQVDWAALKEMNSDVVGWLQVPGTVVNYPVFQTGDNDYYLHHAPDRSDSIGGSVFLDYENTAPGMVDTQSIVYGHHMRNGSQFKQIADMEKQELFDGVDTVWYVTEGTTYKLAPLFVYYASDEDLDVRQFSFETDAEFRTYLKKYLAEARAKRADIDQAIEAVRHVFTLSTCNYEDSYGRTLLVCAPTSEIPGMPDYDAEAAKKAAEEQAAKEKKAAEQKAAAEKAAKEKEAKEKAAAEQAERDNEAAAAADQRAAEAAQQGADQAAANAEQQGDEPSTTGESAEGDALETASDE